MASKRRLPQTGLLGRRTPPPEPVIRAHRKAKNTTPQKPSHLLLQIDHFPNPVTTIGCAIQEHLILGRSDPTSAIQVDIDLTEYHAAEYGVSRRHVEIVRKDNALWVHDLGSRNGTFLNDEPIGSELVRLQDGDTLILGGLVITIWFVFAEDHS
ncbi:MAG: hypothetical protein CUN55_14735 [Phototrophicales bacterium]|nr:MAG: hypothetical protein CUN55_14735 [Phototrophicales bacterium]